jgi:hypothetical protein
MTPTVVRCPFKKSGPITPPISGFPELGLNAKNAALSEPANSRIFEK